MRILFFLVTILLSSILTTTAQDFYLPVSTDSEVAKAAYYKLSEFSSNLNFQKANEQFDQAIEADPNFLMAYVLKIYFSNGEEKAKLIDKALALPTDKLNEAEQIVRQHLTIWDKDPKAKIGENMKALIAAYPKTPQAYEWASLHAAYTDNDNAAALEYAQKLAQLSPDFAPNYNVLGYMYLDEKKMDKAKTAFKKYIELAPNEANSYDSMGDYYMTTKEYEKSAHYYDKAVAKGMKGAKERADKARVALKQ